MIDFDIFLFSYDIGCIHREWMEIKKNEWNEELQRWGELGSTMANVSTEKWRMEIRDVFYVVVFNVVSCPESPVY